MNEVLIVGAGASGLSCARHLDQAGLNVRLMEARGRIGGRVLTQSLDGGGAIELGAEFLHGAPHAFMREVTDKRLSFYDVLDAHLMRTKRGDLRSVPDFWSEVEKTTGKMRSTGTRSVAQFLQRRRGVDLFRAYVEGFYAADLNQAGEVDIKRAESEEVPSLGGKDLFRPFPDYTQFLSRLLKFPLPQENLFFRHELACVHWRPGYVRATCTNGRELEADKIVLTIPLGVLKTGRVRFEPEIPELAAVYSSLHMGHVLRLALEFKDRFWEDLCSKPVSFMHHEGAGHDFPTWWTQAPRHCPVLIAWQGGPRAEAMAEWSEDQKLEAALKSLCQLTGVSMRRLRRELVAIHAHDWSNDLFACGAYSYPGPGGEARAKRWQKPFADTIYFAGEATHDGALRGTVTGAIESGVRAARQVLSQSFCSFSVSERKLTLSKFFRTSSRL